MDVINKENKFQKAYSLLMFVFKAFEIVNLIKLDLFLRRRGGIIYRYATILNMQKDIKFVSTVISNRFQVLRVYT